MVKLLVHGEERYYDERLSENLNALKKAVADDWDGLLLVAGREGVGKSTFAFQLAAYLDPEFCIDRVAWTPEQFVEKVMQVPPYSCIVLDEAYLTFTNRSSIGNLQRTIISMLTMIRSRNLFLIIVSPTIFDLSKYLVVHRALAVFRCYHKGMQRGYWELYGESSKLELYVKGRRDNNWSVTNADLRGRFTSWFPLDKVEYNTRKGAAVDELKQRMFKPEKQQSKESIKQEGQLELLTWLKDNDLLVFGAIKVSSEYFGMRPDSLNRKIRDVRACSLRKKADSRPDLLNNLKQHGLIKFEEEEDD